MLADVHAHLGHFSDQQQLEVLKHAAEVGVWGAATTRMDPSSSRRWPEYHRLRGGPPSLGGRDGVASSLYGDLKPVVGSNKLVAIREVDLDFIENVLTGVGYRPVLSEGDPFPERFRLFPTGKEMDR